jgi:hypothetical protein
MIRYSDYRQGKLKESIKRSSVLTGVELHFDLLQLRLEEAARLPMNLNEAFDPQYAETLSLIAEIDHEINSEIIRQHVQECKEAFNEYLAENVDFSSFLKGLSHQGARLPHFSADVMRRDLRLAFSNFKDAVRQLIEPIIGSRQPPQPAPSQGQGTSASPQGGAGPAPGGGTASKGAPSPQSGSPGPQRSQAMLPPELDPNQPAQQPLPPTGGGSPANPAGSKYSLWDRLHHRTNSGWSNLGKTAAKPLVWVGDRMRDAWKGKYLRDPLPEHVMESLRVIFETSSVDILGQIDSWADELLKFIDDNIQHYAQAATGTAPGKPPAPASNAPTGQSSATPTSSTPAPGSPAPATQTAAPTPSANPSTPSPVAATPEQTPAAPKPPRGINSAPMTKEGITKMLTGSGGLQLWKLSKVARELGVLDKVADPNDGMALAKAIADHVGANIGHRQHLGPIKGKLTPDEIQTLPSKTEDELVELSKNAPGKSFLSRVARLVGVRGTCPVQDVPAAAYARNLYSVIQQSVKDKNWGGLVSKYGAAAEVQPNTQPQPAAPQPAPAGSGEQEMRQPPNAPATTQAEEPSEWDKMVNQSMGWDKKASEPQAAPTSNPSAEPASAASPEPAAPAPAPEDPMAPRIKSVLKGMEEDFNLDLSDPQARADVERIAKAQYEASPHLYPDNPDGHLELLKVTGATYQNMLNKRQQKQAAQAPQAVAEKPPGVSTVQTPPAPEPVAEKPPEAPAAPQPEPVAEKPPEATPDHVPPPPAPTHEPVGGGDKERPKHSHDDVFDSAWNDHSAKSDLFHQAFQMLPDDLKHGVDERTVHHALNRIYDPSKHPTPATLAAEIERKAAQLRVASEAHKLIDPSVRDMDPEMTDRLLHQLISLPTYEIGKLSRSGQLTPEKISEKAQLIANKLSGRLLGEAVKKKLSEFVPKLKSMIDHKGLVAAFDGDEKLADSEILRMIRRFAEGREKLPEQELLQRLASLDENGLAQIADKINKNVGNSTSGDANNDQFGGEDTESAPELEPEDFNKTDDEKEEIKKRRTDSSTVKQQDYDLARIHTKLTDSRMPDGSTAIEYLAKQLGKERDPSSPEGAKISSTAVHGKIQELISSAYENTKDKNGGADADRAIHYLMSQVHSMFDAEADRQRREEESKAQERRARAKAGGMSGPIDDEFLTKLADERRRREIQLRREEEADAEAPKKKKKKDADEEEGDLNRGYRRGKRVEDEEDSFANAY